jgi:hypothetical protein
MVTVGISSVTPSWAAAWVLAKSRHCPQVSYEASTSASLPIRLVTAPTSPTSGDESFRTRRVSQPGGTIVSLLSSTSTSPRATARPWLHAAAKPAFRPFNTSLTRGHCAASSRR